MDTESRSPTEGESEGAAGLGQHTLVSPWGAGRVDGPRILRCLVLFRCSVQSHRLCDQSGLSCQSTRASNPVLRGQRCRGWPHAEQQCLGAGGASGKGPATRMQWVHPCIREMGGF